MNEYLKQANDFLEKTGAKLDVSFSHSGKHFDDDKEVRDIYNVTLTRGSRKYSFKFGNSLNNSGFKVQYGRNWKTIEVDKKDREKFIKSMSLFRSFVKQRHFFDLMPNDKTTLPVEPNAYDILCCLTKYDPGTFEDFCSEFGYDTDSRKAEKTYNAVLDEYKNVCVLFTDDEINELSEIN